MEDYYMLRHQRIDRLNNLLLVWLALNLCFDLAVIRLTFFLELNAHPDTPSTLGYLIFLFWFVQFLGLSYKLCMLGDRKSDLQQPVLILVHRNFHYWRPVGCHMLANTLVFAILVVSGEWYFRFAAIPISPRSLAEITYSVVALLNVAWSTWIHVFGLCTLLIISVTERTETTFDTRWIPPKDR